MSQSANATLFEKQPVKTFTEKAYLDYSMYVILDRALPHLADGLKPVQRRIIYAMHDLGLKASSKYKKSARTVGDVLGKFHPHGDSACYEAMVLLAQPFSYRYPLVDGQGNWGSPDDPKSFAAMRYTEARLAPYADVLLRELHEGTVEWSPNFDGTLEEPKLLPARLPNALLNGATGIAVGMATDIPPHNLREIVNACIHLLEHPKANLSELSDYVQGPDYPCHAEIITPKADIQTMYQTGHGSIRLRAVYCLEKNNIVVTALPFQVSGPKVLEQIAAQMHAKKLPMVVDLRDESDHENPTRLVIILRSNRIEIQELMSHLFASTDLEKSYRVNLNMIGLDGRPKVYTLLDILKEWLRYRLDTVRQRLEYRLNNILNRLHLLEGLLIAYLNIDEVIHIIRNEDKPKPVLMATFNLSEQQTDALLDIKLRHLAKLEEIKIRTEQSELSQERSTIEKLLDSPKRLKTLVRKELEQDEKKYGDVRRSPLVAREDAKAFSIHDQLPTELVTVILSSKGWIRCAKGHEVDLSKLNLRAGDALQATAKGRSNQPSVLIDSTGRSYSLPTHELASARGQGEPLTGKLTPPAGAHFVSVLLGEEKNDYVFASSAGYGFLTQLGQCVVRNRSGKSVLKLSEKSHLLTPQRVHHRDQARVACVTSAGYLLIFPVTELPILPRGKGNKLINIPTNRLKAGEECVVDLVVLDPKSSLTVISGKRKRVLKAKELKAYQSERGKRGRKLPQGFQKVSQLLVIND